MLYQKKNNTLEPLTGSTLYADLPIGTVIASFLAIAPSGYIKADDTVYTKAQYPELYERIPDVFKDTVNETFTIDLREVALKGIGLSSLTTEHYSSTGLTLGEFIEDRLQAHTHRVADYGAGSSTNRDVTQNQPGYTSNAFTLGVYGARTGDTTEVKSVGVNYFIKAKHVALPIDIMDAISEEYVSKDRVPDYSTNLFTTDTTSFTAPKDCVVNLDCIWIRRGTSSTISDYDGLLHHVIKVNGNIVAKTDHTQYGSGSDTLHCWLLTSNLILKAGDVLTSENTDSNTPWTMDSSRCRIFGYVGE